MKPYTQEVVGNYIIREFSQDVHNKELVWHRDEHDRIVEVIEGNKWRFQYDNQLPVTLEDGERFFIPKESYHRVIKGDGNLRIKIFEIK